MTAFASLSEMRKTEQVLSIPGAKSPIDLGRMTKTENMATFHYCPRINYDMSFILMLL